jgi:hypothetical protein
MLSQPVAETCNERDGQHEQAQEQGQQSTEGLGRHFKANVREDTPANAGAPPKDSTRR